jgi:predicted dinucleotide-utilizing enzyme
VAALGNEARRRKSRLSPHSLAPAARRLRGKVGADRDRRNARSAAGASSGLIAEVAGQQAVAQYGETVLRNGVDLLVISVGALADTALLDRLKSAAQASSTHASSPVGGDQRH